MKEILIILGVVGGILGLVYKINQYDKNHPCIKSHVETQYKAPISVVVGGSKYGGGVGIPVGNMKPVEVTVCDVRK